MGFWFSKVSRARARLITGWGGCPPLLGSTTAAADARLRMELDLLQQHRWHDDTSDRIWQSKISRQRNTSRIASAVEPVLIHLDLPGSLCNLVILRWILEIELSYWNTECWILDKASLIVNSRSAWHHLPTLTVVVVRPYPSTLLDTRPVSLLPPSNQHLCIIIFWTWLTILK